MSKESKKPLTYFEKQRDLLMAEIAVSMDSVLNNINALNRSIEGAIAVGKEFDSVATLWSNFYDGLVQMEQLRPATEGEQEESTDDNGRMDLDSEQHEEGQGEGQQQ
jgi:DASH complex subunit DAD1